MSAPNSPLTVYPTTDFSERAAAWLESVGVVRECAACGRDKWHVGEPLALPPQDYETGKWVATERTDSFTVFARTCMTCGHVQLFDAARAGLVPPPKGGRVWHTAATSDDIPAPAP